VKKEFEEYIG
jgi:hypothetical protein